MKKYEKESVETKNVQMTNGGHLVQVTMVISEGKFVSLVAALERYDSIVAKDLLAMLNRSVGK